MKQNNRVEEIMAKAHWFWQHQRAGNSVDEGMSKGIGMGLFSGVILLIVFFVSINFFAENPTPRNEAGLKYTLVTVQEGDSLGKLISQSGLDINTNYLIEQTLKYNNLKGTYLTAGQKIHIPCAE